MSNRTFSWHVVIRRVATASFLAVAVDVHADQFMLKDGRILSGKLVSAQSVDRTTPDKNSPATDVEMVIEIEPGIQTVIHESDLKLNGHRQVDDRAADYARRAKTMNDSADTHYKVAQWCYEQKLVDVGNAHFQRVIDLDPDFKFARAAIDHKQNDAGRWVRVEDEMHERGKVLIKGKWVFPEVSIQSEQQEEIDKRIKALKTEISRRHRECLLGGAKAEQAMAALSAINDPLAAEYIGEKLIEGRAAARKVANIPDVLKRFYIELLSKLDSPFAIRTLVDLCLMDSNDAVRNAAIDAMSGSGRDLAVQLLIPALHSRDNAQVNLAAQALGKLNASEATLDLINALITKHEVQIASQADTYSNQGLTKGGPKSAIIEFNNEDVRNTLGQITGQGRLGFDRAAWLAWFASLYSPPVDDLRRDL